MSAQHHYRDSYLKFSLQLCITKEIIRLLFRSALYNNQIAILKREHSIALQLWANANSAGLRRMRLRALTQYLHRS